MRLGTFGFNLLRTFKRYRVELENIRVKVTCDAQFFQINDKTYMEKRQKQSKFMNKI